MDQHAKLLSNMNEICPNISTAISSYWNKPLTDYIRGFNESKISRYGKISKLSKNTFDQQLHLILKSKFTENIAADLMKQFCENSIIQTGPHCQLYLDSMNFNAILVSLLYAAQKKQSFILILNSSLVTLQSSNGTGPAWIPCAYKSVKILNCSNTLLKKSSVCCINENILSINDESIFQLDDDDQSAMKYLKRLIGQPNPSHLADAFINANSKLISHLSNNKIESVIIDERFCSKILIENLKDHDSFIYKLFSDKDRMLKLIKNLSLTKEEKFGEFLATGTTLFWYLEKTKIQRLSLNSDAFLLESTSGRQFDVAPDSISRALQEEQILPDMFLCYLVSVILPKNYALGGTRMIAYYPLYLKIIRSVLDLADPDEKDLWYELDNLHNFSWAANVIQNPKQPIHYFSNENDGIILDEVLNYYSKISLSSAMQDLKIFKEHPKWSRYI